MTDRIEEFVYQFEPGGNGVPPFISTGGAADRIEKLTSSALLNRTELLQREGGPEALAKFDAGDLSDCITYERLLDEAIDAQADAEDRLHSFH